MGIPLIMSDQQVERDYDIPKWAKQRLPKSAEMYRIMEEQWPNGFCTIGVAIVIEEKVYRGPHLFQCIERWEKDARQVVP